MTYLICVGFTFLTAVSDIRTRSIPLWLLVLGLTTAGIQLITAKDPISRVFGFMVGMVFFLFSLILKNHFGAGDGIMIAVIGLMLGIYRCVSLILIAFALSSVFGVVLMLIKKKNLKYSLPFVPFLFAGEILFFISEVTG